MATVKLADPSATYQGADPSFLGVYIHDIHDIASTVAAKNFLSLFNPSGSGRQIVVVGVSISDYSVNSVTGSTSMEVWRTTAASAGTLVAAANVNRFVTTMANPLAEVRTGNPTVTLAGTDPLVAFPPAQGTGAQPPTVVSPTPGAAFIILPGQGVVFVQNAGDVDERWNIQIVWAEKSL